MSRQKNLRTPRQRETADKSQSEESMESNVKLTNESERENTESNMNLTNENLSK